MNRYKVIILLFGFTMGFTGMVKAQESDSTFLNKAYRINWQSFYDLHDTLSFRSREWQLYMDNISRLIRVVNQKEEPTFAQFLHLFHDPQAEVGDEAEIVAVPYGGDEQLGLDTVRAKLKHPTKYSSGVLMLIRKYNFLFHLRDIRAYYIQPILKVQTNVPSYMRHYFMTIIIENKQGAFHKLVFNMYPIQLFNPKKQNGLIDIIYDGDGHNLSILAIDKYEQEWKEKHKHKKSN